MPSTRRTLLASLGAGVAGFAGCLNDDAPGSGTPTGTDTPTATPTDSGADATTTLGASLAVGDRTVTVSGVDHRHTFRYLSAPDAFGVTVADGQFVFVGVEATGSGTPPDPEAFGFAFGDQQVGATTFLDYGPVDPLSVGEREYSVDHPQGYLAFEVPAPLGASTAAVTLGDARWTVPSSALDPLSDPAPSFAVTYGDVPASVPRDEPITVPLSVTNEGEGDGVFRGAVNHTGPMYGADEFTLSVPAGESRSHDVVVDYYVGENLGADRVQFEVLGPGTDRSFRVALTGETATPREDTPSATPVETETGTHTGST